MSPQVFISVLLHILLVVLIIILIYFAIYVVLKTWIRNKFGICTSTERLTGKVVLVTGGNTGIGLETARGLAKRGAKVIIASRNQQRSEAAVADIIKSTGNYNVEYKHLDLANFSKIRTFVEDFNNCYNRLDILVNNAGILAVNDVTEDGVHIIMQINYYGPFLLTMLLMRKLIASRPSRIVNVSSCALIGADLNNIYGINTNPLRVYCNSKIFQMLWTKALAKKLPEGITVNALHPGLVGTEILPMNNVLKKVLTTLIGPLLKTPEEGAQTTLHLCVSKEVQKITGGYFEDCKLVPPRNSLVTNEEAAEKIWNQSIMVTKIDKSLTVFNDVDTSAS
ncbi:retinol dehydrogenase 12-like [Manduca sexta]|uniref:retinol dehydrogenase 12-like n=1 Tax=Manduca sexta TaxID=7130 RepID=UPI00188F613E|nr:retinol dehydrogenase 12-like [Manduca sexta]